MQIATGLSDPEKRLARGNHLHEHNVHQILGLFPVTRESQRVAEQGHGMAVVQLPESRGPTSRELPKEVPVDPVVTGFSHVWAIDERAGEFCQRIPIVTTMRFCPRTRRV